MIDRNYLIEKYAYNSLNGELRKKGSRIGRGKPGCLVGSINGFGYLMTSISVNGKRRNIGVHQIAFIIANGYLPEVVEHKDGNPLNNRADNLRPATQGENMRNTRLSALNTSGAKGIHLQKNGRYHAYANIGGKRHNIGYFSNMEDAINAREEYTKKLHGEFYCDGNR